MSLPYTTMSYKVRVLLYCVFVCNAFVEMFIVRIYLELFRVSYVYNLKIFMNFDVSGRKISHIIIVMVALQ